MMSEHVHRVVQSHTTVRLAAGSADAPPHAKACKEM